MHNRSLFPSGIPKHCLRGWLVVMALFAAANSLLFIPAYAVEMTSIYTVEVPLDPDERNPRRTAYRLALNQVLVRMTGSTAVAESEELASMFPNPERYVRQFQPGPDDTLIVSLYGEEIERVLRQAGAPIWSADRPLTLVWLAVDRGRGDREIIAADDQGGSFGAVSAADERNEILRNRVKEVAARRGIPVAFPLLDTTDLQSLSFSDIWGGFDEQLIAASQRYNAPSVLVGRIRPETSQAHRWTWYRNGLRQDWRGEPDYVINLLADTIAASDALAGNELSEYLQLTISGIDSVRDYGQVQQYLESLRALDRLMIKAVSADRITYEVEIRGGAERLRAALAASNILVAVNSSATIEPDSYRRQTNQFGNPDRLDNRDPLVNSDRPGNSDPLGNPMGDREYARSLEYFFREIERPRFDSEPVPN
ncbi:MAG: DUF2066 domain-containing protein [Woeseiaceae bacterium]